MVQLTPFIKKKEYIFVAVLSYHLSISLSIYDAKKTNAKLKPHTNLPAVFSAKFKTVGSEGAERLKCETFF